MLHYAIRPSLQKECCCPGQMLAGLQSMVWYAHLENNGLLEPAAPWLATAKSLQSHTAGLKTPFDELVLCPGRDCKTAESICLWRLDHTSLSLLAH